MNGNQIRAKREVIEGKKPWSGSERHLLVTAPKRNGKATLDPSPFRYCGEYFDFETGEIYLRARSYDPTTGRFTSADTHWNPGNMIYGDEPQPANQHNENDSIYLPDFNAICQSANLFSYCRSNPVNLSDGSGEAALPSWAKKLIAAVAVVAVVAAVAAITVATAGTGTAAAVIAIGALKGAAIGMVSGAAIGAATGAVKHRVSTGSWEGAGQAALDEGASGALSGAITGAITGAISGAVKVGQAASAWGQDGGRSALQNMSSHYSKHVLKEGHTYLGKNVLQYTANAKGFFLANQGAMRITSTGNFVIRAMFAGHKAGGFFSQAGKIFSFFS